MSTKFVLNFRQILTIFLYNIFGGVRLMDNFANRMKMLRKQMGLNQTQLAKRMGTSKSLVSYYENQDRSPSPEVLIKLSNIFNVSTDYLLGLESEQSLKLADLSKEDIELLQHTLETLRNKNNK